ncbi:DUF2634 domain-containing protein [Paenibacillus sp. 19GGS1-52]|uniref:DUF2634 domain-containing protein n=1 Tax=Paenibacillus sp. 19GGS1-52 TaxID=2758563 RepID=UPI001EFB07B0|nr:DUF2634 domain-containing protein [Paenibacillus sp. 19GGS1-52]ULO09676.1 DUF2634 domain-containing protein [Paenibacillus sp. 19GGS1-52]
MFPDDELTLEEIEALSAVSTVMGKVFLFDFDTKEYVLINGRPVEATYEQAIKQWVTFLLTADSDSIVIYQGTDFGMSIKQFIGNRDMDRISAEFEIERQLKEKIILHPEIIDIEEVVITRDGSRVVISLNIITSRGIIDGSESEVVFSG